MTIASEGDSIMADRDTAVAPFAGGELAGGPKSLAPLPAHRLTLPIVDVLRTIHDPEIPVNIFDLGLIYALDVDQADRVSVEMTLTTPNCPVAGSMPEQVRQAVLSVDGVADCDLDLVWDPPWHPGMMADDARLALGFPD